MIESSRVGIKELRETILQETLLGYGGLYEMGRHGSLFTSSEAIPLDIENGNDGSVVVLGDSFANGANGFLHGDGFAVCWQYSTRSGLRSLLGQTRYKPMTLEG